MDPDMRIIDFEEEAYRRGYYDGWSMAINHMRYLIFGEKKTPEETCEICTQHKEVLNAWSEEDDSAPIPPGIKTSMPALLR